MRPLVPLTSFLAICVLAACGAPPPPGPVSFETPQWLSLQSCDLQQPHFVRHRFFRFELSRDASMLGRKDQTFRVVEGLADSRHISFEAANYPGHYLRHEDGAVLLEPYEDTDAYRAAATFIPQESNAAYFAGDSYACDVDEAWSFQAYDRPGYFLRRNMNLLRLEEFPGYFSGSWVQDPEPGRPFREASSFLRVAPRADVSAVVDARSLRSVNYPDRFVAVRSLGVLGPAATPAEREDATLRLVAGLATPGAEGGSAISFESVRHPGYYLRHRGPNTRIALERYDGTPEFAAQATFTEGRGLADPADGVSYEAHAEGAGGFYLRHRNFELRLESGDSALFRADATFREEDPLLRPLE